MSVPRPDRSVPHSGSTAYGPRPGLHPWRPPPKLATYHLPYCSTYPATVHRRRQPEEIAPVIQSVTKIAHGFRIAEHLKIGHHFTAVASDLYPHDCRKSHLE